jgi:hypothetical protein
MLPISRRFAKGRLIGMTGFPGAGKDSFADLLVEKHGWVKLAWADPLYEMAIATNPILFIYKCIPVRLKWLVGRIGWTRAKLHPQVRRYLQILGTECVRDNLGEDVFVGALSRKIDDLLYKGIDVVISGCRFDNEIEAITTRGGIIVRVNRESRKRRKKRGRKKEHIADSGRVFKKAHMTFENDGTLEDLGRFASVLNSELKKAESDQMCEVVKYLAACECAANRAYDLIISSAAPAGTPTRDYTDRHNVEIAIEDPETLSGIVLVDGECAGRVNFDDGTLTVDVYIAR